MEQFILEQLYAWAWPVFISLSGGLISLYREQKKLSQWDILKILGLSMVGGLLVAPAIAVLFNMADEVTRVVTLFCAFGAKYIFEGVETFMVAFSHDPVKTIKSIWKGSSNGNGRK